MEVSDSDIFSSQVNFIRYEAPIVVYGATHKIHSEIYYG